MADEKTGQAELLTLTAAEMALYQSGIRRGHSETLNQLKRQLEAANAGTRAGLPSEGAKRTKAELRRMIGDVVTCYESFASQLAEPAAVAARDQTRLLTEFCEKRVRARTLADRFRAAARGALGGWRVG